MKRGMWIVAALLATSPARYPPAADGRALPGATKFASKDAGATANPPARMPALPNGTSRDEQALVRLVEQRYRNVQTLRATFLERYVEGGTERIESGTVYFRRPGKMRWEYESPERKLFVSDGKRVWFYVPADRTVVRTPAKESADWRMPFALLTREPKLSRICSRIALGEQGEALEAGHAVLRCTPKENPRDIREILIEIDEKSGDVGRVLVREAGGVEIDFRFANWRRNVPVAESQFRFATPVGVAIVDGLADEASFK